MDLLYCKSIFILLGYVIEIYVIFFHRVPEIGEDLPEKNPLLREDGLPEFNNISIEKCLAAIGQQSVDLEKNVRNLEDSLSKTKEVKNIFRDVLIPLEKISSPLETTWGLAKTLYLGNSSLMPTKSYLTIHERARKARAAKFGSLQIFKALNECNTKNIEGITEEQKRVIGKFVLEGKLNGIEIEGSKKHELNEILNKLGQERAKFRGKVDTSIKQFSQKITDYNLVRDFPPSFLQAISTDHSQPTKGPWKISLQPYIVNNFLEYCPDRTMRWNVWQADNRKASGYAEKSLENSTHLEQIRFLRRNQAKILGYESYIHMSMETKMAGKPENVRNMLSNLLEHAKPAQERELHDLESFAEVGGFKENLEIFDIPYWKRKQLKSVYKFDEEVLREYFPLPTVLTGLFELSEKLFGIKIQERKQVDTWHEDVRFFDIFDGSDGKEPIAGFYVDLYTREDDKMLLQQNSGWMVGIRNRSTYTNTKPLSSLIFNFQPPIYGKPSLLSFNDVKMLFHKFGYGLQHLLTKATYSEVAGVSNIEWDAVEISGHVLSQFLYNPEVLQSISSHYANEESLPDELLKAIQGQSTHMAGFDLSRELYLSALDLELHSSKDFWLDVVKTEWPKYNVLPFDKKDSHPCSMTSIFSGEWGGAYFSSVWSRLVAADVYSAFYETTNKSQTMEEVGKRFRDTFLALGGACSPAEVFRRFRGRDPSPIALVTSLGLTKIKTIPEDK